MTIRDNSGFSPSYPKSESLWTSFSFLTFRTSTAAINLLFYFKNLLKTKCYIAWILFRRVIIIDDSCSTLSTWKIA